MRHGDDSGGECRAITLRQSSVTAYHRQPAHFSNHRLGGGEADGCDADGDVFIDFGQHAAGTQHDHWTDLRIAAETEDHFGKAFFHALDEDAVDFRGRMLGFDAGQYLRGRSFQRRGVGDVEHHAAGIGLVQDVGREDFCDNRKLNARGLLRFFDYRGCCMRDA